MQDRAVDPLLGRTIAGKFTIESLLGSGGMGAVYKARQIALDKVVAIKVLLDEKAQAGSFAVRFRREAKAASRLNHPNSIQIIDFGEEPDGLLYIAMEYLDGLDLHHIIEQSWPLSDERVIDILSQTLAALSVAHEMKVVHRDLKPENIMIMTRIDDEGRVHDVVKVCDFGIAKLTESIPPPAPTPSGAATPAPRALTTKGIVVGTPEYMAPEQCRGETPDARTDLYAVGAILYQLLAGRIPFQADNPIDLVLMHVASEPVPPTRVNPNASPRLEAVCLKALQKKRQDRYASAREMRADLRGSNASGHSGQHRATTPMSAEAKVTISGAATLPALQVVSGLGDTVAAQQAAAPPQRGAMRVWATLAVVVIGVGATALAMRGDDRPHVEAPASVSASAQVAVREPDPTTTVPIETTTAPVVPPSATPKSTSDRHALAPSAFGFAVVPSASTTAVAPPPSTTAATIEPPPAPSPVAIASARAPDPSATAATQPPFDPSTGRVVWSVSGAGGGATTTNVSRAIGRAAGAWTGCYQAGLRSRGARIEGTATLRLTCDEEGRVVGATMSGLDMPDVIACIKRSAIGTTVPNVDTGAAWATIALTFQVPR